MSNLIASYANVTDFTHMAFWNLVAEYNLPLPDSHLDLSYEQTLHFEKLKRELLGEDRENSVSIVDIELEHLKRHQPAYVAFLDSCMEGRPDMDFLNLKYNSFMKNNLKDYGFKESNDPWKPEAVLISSYRTLEEVIAFRGLILPFYQGNGRTFSRVGRCGYCSKYYIAERSDAKFCERKCKNDFHRKK